MNNTDGLKPCRFCKSNNLGISNKTTTVNYTRKRHVAVYCKKCNAYGPRILTEETKYPEFCSDVAIIKAKNAWNNGL